MNTLDVDESQVKQGSLNCRGDTQSWCSSMHSLSLGLSIALLDETSRPSRPFTGLLRFSKPAESEAKLEKDEEGGGQGGHGHGVARPHR